MSLYGGITLPGRPALENVRRLDLLAIPMIRRMTRYGIAVDVDYLRAFSSELGREMAALEADIASYLPRAALAQFASESAAIEERLGPAEFNAASADQIRSLLFDTLRIGQSKRLTKTTRGKVSTGKKQLELCRDEHPVVRKVLDYRERAKLKTAFADALPEWARLHPRNTDGSCPYCEMPHVESTWRVHTEFLTTRAETGRFSSRRPNLQQIPVRSDLGGRIRRAFLASPGTRLVSVDFSQIELRDLAHLANAGSMIRLYHEGKDIHLFTACECFRKDYEQYAALAQLKEMGKLALEERADWNHFSLHCRLPSKNVNFMIVYGATDQGLQAQLALSGLFWEIDRCNRFIDRWFDLYPEVRAYIDLQHYRARRYGYVWDPFGRIRRVPEVRSCHSYIRAQGLRQAMNMPIQSCSAGQMKLVMGELEEVFLDLSRAHVWVWPLLTIHDQLIVEAGEEKADLVRAVMEDFFVSVMHDQENGRTHWRVPIQSDGEVLTRWSKEEAA